MGPYPKQNLMLQPLSPPPMDTWNESLTERSARQEGLWRKAYRRQSKIDTKASLKVFSINLLHFWHPIFKASAIFWTTDKDGPIAGPSLSHYIPFEKQIGDYPLSKTNTPKHWIKMLCYQAMHWPGCLILLLAGKDLLSLLRQLSRSNKG